MIWSHKFPGYRCTKLLLPNQVVSIIIFTAKKASVPAKHAISGFNKTSDGMDKTSHPITILIGIAYEWLLWMFREHQSWVSIILVLIALSLNGEDDVCIRFTMNGCNKEKFANNALATTVTRCALWYAIGFFLRMWSFLVVWRFMKKILYFY